MKKKYARFGNYLARLALNCVVGLLGDGEEFSAPQHRFTYDLK